MEFGRAMGNEEPVTPILPNSDYWSVFLRRIKVVN
jgi:hypothetical protein